jgi:hypothetical protein
MENLLFNSKETIETGTKAPLTPLLLPLTPLRAPKVLLRPPEKLFQERLIFLGQQVSPGFH